jgi:hypothetical protein
LRSYVLDWTVISLEAGKVPCITDEEEARKRDELFRSGFQPPMPDFPRVREGLVQLDKNGQRAAPAGELSLQARVERDGHIDLFDRVFDAGGKWQLLSTAGDPRASLRAAQVEILEQLGTVFAHIATDTSGDAVDVDGEYAAYHDARGIQATLARPDFYVFGTATTLDDLPAVVDELIAQLGVRADQGASR